MRSRPRKRTKKRGVHEKRNQDKFSQAHYWLQPLLDFVRVGFRCYSPNVEGFNAAKSFCLKNAFTGEPGKQKIDPSRVQVSYGDLPLPSNIKMKRSGDYLLQFNWDKKDDGGTNTTRQCCWLTIVKPASGTCSSPGNFVHQALMNLSSPRLKSRTITCISVLLRMIGAASQIAFILER